MFVQFLRENRVAAYLLLMLRLYLGWSWMIAGWGKVSGGFDASGFLAGAVQSAGGEHPAVQGWWAEFLSGVAIPNVALFNILVPWGELLVGIALILGSFTTFAALMGIIMNFAFMFSGTTSTNPMMVLLTIFILVAGINAGRIGLDRWIIPAMKTQFRKWEDRRHTTGTPKRPALHH
ncbi:DoxX family protein [Planococcus lenghuensis]|uniref:Crp/Fnr family transcriptional regulator n=1 Tax=Planococcus lenghuensis TaxID=2213202 RepID=A0A1Q2L2X9_9BACL|nr:DoxX family protein [Planococcus lenghuensis]AQQ54791.1 Crp/Fnr family transcriptional regulator [Planococcus lenghuensis]